MHQHAWRERLGVDEAAAREAGTGTAAAATAGTATAEPEVLARMPDLDAVESSDESDRKRARSDGRLLGQGLSTKLLIGGGILLVLAATVPFLINRDIEPEGGKPPAPDADVAPAFQPETARTPASRPGSSGTSYEPNMSFSPQVPMGPDFINPTQDAGQTGPPQTVPWDTQEVPDSWDKTDRTGTTPAERHPRFSAWPNSGYYHQFPQGPAVANGPEVRANQRMSLAERPQITRPAARAPRPVEPGVARLQGIIEKPSLRTSYEHARRGVH